MSEKCPARKDICNHPLTDGGYCYKHGHGVPTHHADTDGTPCGVGCKPSAYTCQCGKPLKLVTPGVPPGTDGWSISVHVDGTEQTDSCIRKPQEKPVPVGELEVKEKYLHEIIDTINDHVVEAHCHSFLAEAFATIRALEAEIDGLKNDVAFWMGEGDGTEWPPENKEWKKLSILEERTPEQLDRMSYLQKLITWKTDSKAQCERAEKAEAERDELSAQVGVLVESLRELMIQRWVLNWLGYKCKCGEQWGDGKPEIHTKTCPLPNLPEAARKEMERVERLEEQIDRMKREAFIQEIDLTVKDNDLTRLREALDKANESISQLVIDTYEQYGDSSSLYWRLKKIAEALDKTALHPEEKS